ncbi:putative porin, partial [Escherichia coli]|nr:putative porin [Escherichia coli]
MASTEEKLLTLLLSAEHLKEAAKEQQKAVADSLAVARETLKGYREISDSVAQQVRDEVRQEVQKMDIAGLIGESISADFQRLEKSGGKMKINADALDKEIS